MAKIIGLTDDVSDKKFKPGDFITFSNKPGAFAIYEGVDISTTTYKKLTAILTYDPSKYTQTTEGYKMIPYMETSTKTKACEKTLDTDEDCYWTRRCNAEEMEKALEVMRDYGYLWDEENLAVVAEDSGDVITKIRLPKAEYNGQIIKPMSKKFKRLLKLFCLKKNEKVSYNYSDQYSRYWDMMGEGYGYEDYWD